MVFFSIFETLCATESLFNINLNCFLNGGSSNNDVKNSEFSLSIVKNAENDGDFELNFINSRVTIFDNRLQFVSEPTQSIILPSIYIKKGMKSKNISDVIHNDISTFYKTFVKSIIDSKRSLKIHVVLNKMHILLVGTPLFDNIENVIGCHLIEIPYKETHVVKEDVFIM
jgi:hypothetical protein